MPVFMAGCFPKSELVYTGSDVHIPIGSLTEGDKICSWDVEQKKTQYTVVIGIHTYTVMEIICFNGTMRVSSSHPLMVLERGENGILLPKWKVAIEVNIGDHLIGYDSKNIIIRSKSVHWYDAGMEVLNLSTDSGVPFLVGGCVVRADNAKDNIEWADSPITQKMVA